MSNFGEPVTDHPIDSVLLEFIGDIGSLRSTAHMTGTLLTVLGKKAIEDYEGYISKHCETAPGPDSSTIVTFKPAKAAGYKKSVDWLIKSQKSRTLVPRSFLVSLVSQYDVFLGRLVKELFKMQPNSLFESGRKLDARDVLQASSISEIRDQMLEEEIETLLRKSHNEQFEWLESRFHMKLTKDLKCWGDFVEITQRRNLFVHSDGIVSKQYLDTCKKFKVKHKIAVNLGDKLFVNKAYIDNAYETFFEIGCKLAQVLWRKHDSKSMSDADHCLNEVSVRLMTDKDFSLAKRLLDFACDILPRHSSEEYRLYFVVNRALAYKLAGGDSKCAEFVRKEDWSATSDIFKMACAVLMDDESEVLALMYRFGADGPFPEEGYREWPFFSVFRKKATFGTAFEQVFGTPLLQKESIKEVKVEDGINTSAESPSPKATIIH